MVGMTRNKDQSFLIRSPIVHRDVMSVTQTPIRRWSVGLYIEDSLYGTPYIANKNAGDPPETVAGQGPLMPMDKEHLSQLNLSLIKLQPQALINNNIPE